MGVSVRLTVVGKLPKEEGEFAFTVDVLPDEKLFPRDEKSPRMLRFWTMKRKSAEDDFEDVEEGSFCTVYCEGQEDQCQRMLYVFRNSIEREEMPFARETFEKMSWGLDSDKEVAAYYWSEIFQEALRIFSDAESVEEAVGALRRVGDLSTLVKLTLKIN